MDIGNSSNLQFTPQVLAKNSNFPNFRSNATNLEPIDDLYDPPTGLVVVLSIFYGSISFLAVVGNFLVMWIVATSRRMQNVTNCFIANLALADIVIGLFSIPFQFQAALLQRWNLPEFMCPFCPFVQVLSVSVSVFTLSAIAIDRHRAILYPLSARPSKKIAKIIIAGIWLLGIIVATPMMIALRVIQMEDRDKKTTKPFCESVNLSDSSMLIYRTILLFLQYIIPLSIISFVYARMAIRLWGTKAPGNAEDSRDATLIKNKKKVIKMLVIVVTIFALCWLPLQTYQVLQNYYQNINEYRYINIIFFCFDWLAMSNSCYNPFIYGIYNEKFKKEFKSRFPCCNKRNARQNSTFENNNLTNTNSTILSRYSRRGREWARPSRNFQKCINVQSKDRLSNSREFDIKLERSPLRSPEENSVTITLTNKKMDLLVHFDSTPAMCDDELQNIAKKTTDIDRFLLSSEMSDAHSEATGSTEIFIEKSKDGKESG